MSSELENSPGTAGNDNMRPIPIACGVPSHLDMAHVAHPEYLVDELVCLVILEKIVICTMAVAKCEIAGLILPSL